MNRTATFAALLLGFVSSLCADDGQNLLRLDHYVRVKSEVPTIAGQLSAIYVREVVRAGNMRGASAGPVVLFIHGAGTPAEVAFDEQFQDYSWMAYLANAGFDVFSMDMTGYGRSTRPPAMNDPCNLAKVQQTAFVPGLLAAPCSASYGQQMTTLASDWNDIGGVVDYLLANRKVAKLSLIGWSLGGPRSGGFAAQHQDKIDKIVLLAPAFNRNASATPPATLPANGPAFNTQSHAEFMANWDRQVGCPNQIDPASAAAVWAAMLESDPVGATWGTGVRRAPQVTSWGWNAQVAGSLKIPALLVAGVHDKQVLPASVKNLYDALGSESKVFAELACSSHNALWERNHTLLFQASLDWLTTGKVSGSAKGEIRLGFSAQ
jgi:pimeloyl-ACP methyl ester carboxylesterase